MDESGEKIKLLSLKKCGKRKKREEVVASCKTSKTSKPLPMDESGEKEMKLQILLLSLKDLLIEYADCGEVGRTIVSGYDTKLLQDVVVTALTNFAITSQNNEEEAVVASCKTSKPLPMDESGEKEVKLQILLLSLKDLLSEYGDPSGCSEVGKTIVNGYDTKLLQDVVETALTNFASPSQKKEPVVALEKTLPDEKEMKLQMLLLSLKDLLSEYADCGTIINGYDTKLLQDVVETALTNSANKQKELAVAAWKTSKHSSVVKEMKELREIDDYGHALPGCRKVGRIAIKGYDTRLSYNLVVKALRNHFSQCGSVTDVYVTKRPGPNGTKILSDYSLVYFVGEGAVENALRLDGTDFGGCTLSIISYPFKPYAYTTVSLTVKGFDASLSEMVIERNLAKIFFSCGEVLSVFAYKDGSAHLSVRGEDAAEKVQKLNGSSFMGHHRLVVQNVYYPKICIFHGRGIRITI